jgi:hypothetical protein
MPISYPRHVLRSGHPVGMDPAVRLGPRQVDPLVELAINGAEGGVDLFTMARGDEVELTITNEIIRTIHPTGRDEFGNPVKAGLVDPYVPDGPYRGPGITDPWNVGYDGTSGGGTMGIGPNGNVVLAIGYRFRGAWPDYAMSTLVNDVFFGGEVFACSTAGLAGGMRTQLKGSTVARWQVTDSFCYVFPAAPGCAPCTIYLGRDYNGGYYGVGRQLTGRQFSGDIMVVEGGLSEVARRGTFYTGANRIQRYGGVLYQNANDPYPVDTTVPVDESLDLFTDTHLGVSPAGGSPHAKAFIWGLGPHFREVPEDRIVRLRLSDDAVFDYASNNGPASFDPHGGTYYNPGEGTEYEISVRAFMGGGFFESAPPLPGGEIGVSQRQKVQRKVGIGHDGRSVSGAIGIVGREF